MTNENSANLAAPVAILEKINIMKKLCLFACIFVLANLAIHAQTGIHKIDFKNFTYRPSCTDLEDGKNMEKITVKDGEFSRDKDKDGNDDHFDFTIREVAYGDLTSDKEDEALILSNCNTGGTGQFTEGFIYTLRAGQSVLLVRVPGGDRADGGLRSLTVENGLLVVDANDASEGSGACCPEFALKSTYRLTGDKLTEIGKGIRRELYPAERISFAKGASRKTFTIKLSPDDLKRYVLGAAEGQTLTVTVNTDAASLRLLGGNDISDGTKFSAKLEKKGDYVFEVGNWGVNTIEVTVTVSIK